MEGALQRLGAKPGRQQEVVSSADYEALKRELQEKERALAEQSVELVILRKNEWGFVGPIASQWLQAQIKLENLSVIANSQQQDVSARRSCLLLLIEHRRVVRWQGDGSPGNEPGLFQASFSTVYRVLKAHHLMSTRGPGGAHSGNSKAPVRKALTGPNQRWCWDISYLLTFQKGMYLYLYVLLDEWSRKIIQWRVSWLQTAEESRLLLEGGLAEENILDLPEDQRPELINDRGRQMKARPIQRLCEEHGLPQLFARPPNSQRQSVHRISLQHRQASPGICRGVP